MNAIFFDLDGTLFDTRADLAATVNHTRRDLGLSEWSADDIIANVGQGARYLLEHSIPEAADDPSLVERFMSHYAEHCCEALEPYPQMIETLEELKCRGWLLGVNTNKPNFAVKLILQKFNLTHFFGEAVIAGGDGYALKPDASSIRACAARLQHTLSSHDWMVGDSWTDLRCAANAGVKGAFCAFGFGSRKEAPCDAILNSFEDILLVL